MGLIKKPEVQTQYNNSCKQASIAHPNVVSRNRSTGWIRPVHLGTRPVDTGLFLVRVPKWSVATGCKPTCDRLMLFLDRLTLPLFSPQNQKRDLLPVDALPQPVENTQVLLKKNIVG